MVAVFRSTTVIPVTEQQGKRSPGFGHGDEGGPSKFGYLSKPLRLGSQGKDKINPYDWTYPRLVEAVGIRYTRTQLPEPSLPSSGRLIGKSFQYPGFSTEKALALSRNTILQQKNK
jgi:hypothetical protein